MSGLPSWAVHGQKVVCVKIDGWVNEHGESPSLVPPKFGEVATISMVRDYDDRWFLNLTEHHSEALFAIECFQPVAEDSTEAQLFRCRHYGADAPLVLA